MAERIGFRNMATAAADDHRQLGFVIELVGERRLDQRLAMAHQTSVEAGKYRRIFGHRGAALLRVGEVVEPDAEYFVCTPERRQTFELFRIDNRAVGESLHRARESAVALTNQYIEIARVSRFALK